MSSMLEATMLICFGLSWPINTMKAYRARSAKNMSLPFILLIIFGYIAGISAKLLSQLIDQALYVNNKTTDMSVDRDNGTLDYCRLHDITIQAWSPLQFGMFGGCFIDHPDFPEMNKTLQKIGDAYGVSKTAVAIAWILRHPARMQAIAGTMNPVHLKEICDACKVDLTHNEWYRLYLSAGKFLP